MTSGPDESKMRDTNEEPFVSRWSRLKDEARQQPPEAATKAADHPREPAPRLPAVAHLTPDSDYRGFFHPKVGQDVRRAALKKLFSDPRFNVMDGLDVYIDDYSKSEPIPAAMLAGLKQAQDIIACAREHEEERARQEQEKLKLAQAAPERALETPASQLAPGTESAKDGAETVRAGPDSTEGPVNT
jgi:hypothetical protein